MTDDDEKVWNVFRRKRDSLCLVQKAVVTPGNYDKKFGPDTKRACEDWVQNNCEQPQSTCD